SSMIALSVSTSPIGSPDLTASPSFLSHLTSRPSSIVGESASMNTLVAIVVTLSVEVHDFAHGRDGLRQVGLGGLLEALGVRHWDVLLVYAHDRRVQVIEALALHVIDHLGANPADRPPFLEHYAAIRLLHRRRNRVD